MNEPEHNTDRPRRRIRSFVRREGRLTPAQRRALDALWPRFGLDFGSAADPAALVPPGAAVTLEIGFGNGDSLAEMAAADPGGFYLGIEVHRPGVGRLLKTLDERGIDNVRLYCHDAVEVLEQRVPDAWLDRVLLYFPDPWPKKKHHKRRIVQPPFVALLARKLKPGGLLHMATDWAPYAEHMLEVMRASDAFINTSPAGDFVPRPDWRPRTRFERRGQRLGHAVFDLLFRRR
ncbi:MAG TPA: tRNA (guanosine(46)-N7)-methyltransferase TrmB [Gammaproteobacteria bacterium]|nr:tRNA (guanosine(46)-N7)-methyltransferase TrmB [Gammaproteobacteria bacterium]